MRDVTKTELTQEDEKAGLPVNVITVLVGETVTVLLLTLKELELLETEAVELWVKVDVTVTVDKLKRVLKEIEKSVTVTEVLAPVVVLMEMEENVLVTAEVDPTITVTVLMELHCASTIGALPAMANNKAIDANRSVKRRRDMMKVDVDLVVSTLR